MFSDLRVHQLKLRGPSYEAIQHGAIVVEDALRTASFPGLPPNGLLLIHRLNLGKLPACPTSVAVVRRIESQLLTSGLTVIRKDAEDQPQALVVWFRDEVEPYALLAGLLARNIHPQSWYWPRAVMGWSAQMTIGQGLRYILHEVSGTQAGIAGATRVVEQLITSARVEAFGKSLQPQDGHILLALGGIQFPSDDTAKGYTDRAPLLFRHLDRSWRQAFGRLVPQWGPRDARTVWLAHVAICARHGMISTLAVTGLLQQVYKLQREMPTPAPQQSRRTTPRNRTGIIQTEDTALEYPLIEAPYATVTPEDAPVDHKKDSTAPTYTQRGDTTPLLDGSVAAKSDFIDDQYDRQARKHPKPSYASWEIEIEGAESGYAGLAFLVQVLEWLEIRATLAAHPLLEACHLPTRILWHCVDHLGIPHEDPICKFLADLPPVRLEDVINFVAPAVWKKYCWPPTSDERVLVMRRVQGIPQRRMLCDNNGKLAIAVWSCPMPPAIRKWIQGYTILRLPAVPPVKDLDRIISTYVSAIDYFLNRYAQTDLRRMVKRPGYVAATPTHLDITFDQNELNIGIRRAGLDIDPGWVPWLGRVIQFHYIEDEG